MSEPTESNDLLSDLRVKRARRPSSVKELFPGPEVKASEIDRSEIVLRQLDNGSGFSRTLSCAPGTIIVLPHGREAGNYEPFRTALLGKRDQVGVTVKLGSHELHCSEIHSISSVDVMLPGQTLRAVLHAIGITDSEMKSLAQSLGLDRQLEALVVELSAAQVGRVAVLAAILSRSRLVYLDMPLSRIEPEWLPAIANLILQAVMHSNRVIFVTGVEKLPRIWKSSPVVFPAGLELVESGQEDAHQLKQSEYQRKLRQLFGTSHNPEDTIVTYPQRIFRGRTPSGRTLVVESIVNPIPVGAKEPSADDNQVVSSTTLRRTKPGDSLRGKRPTLTEVSVRDRIINGAVARQVKRISGVFTMTEPETPTPTKYRIEQRMMMGQHSVLSLVVAIGILIAVIGFAAQGN